MKRLLFVILACLCAFMPLAAADEPGPLYGFTQANSRTERDWENKFRALPSPQIQRDTMQRLTAHPHHVGSPMDKQNAEWILSKFKEWGFDAH
ncbi:MAG TPA: folate hydrolase, partial [Terriglobales bacterium]